jgi:hypothetical protein
MSDFAEKENERTFFIDLEELPESLTYKLPEADFTYSRQKFGIDEYLKIEYYEAKFERAFPGLLQQFPCLYYMVEEWYTEATRRTPLDEIEAKKQGC